MSDLLDRVKDTFPANGDVAVPLQSNITITLSGLDYDEDSLKEGFFIEGPDTDQYIGPGLLDLASPQNISQGDLDDFLQSPGYKGIVQGTTTTSGIAGDTVITFDPELPLSPLTQYTVNLTGVLDALEAEIDGFVTFDFTSGTGSIEEIPSTVSTSVLSAAIAETSTPGVSDSTPLAVVSTTPSDHNVQQETTLNEIVVEFNKTLDPASVTDKVTVKTVPSSDHPEAVTNSQGNLATSLTVEGKKLKIKI
jgi:hypothetical protein